MQPVIGVGYTQEPNAAGLLQDRLVVTITDPGELSQIDVTVPLNVDNPDIAVTAIDNAYSTCGARGKVRHTVREARLDLSEGKRKSQSRG